MIIDKSYGRDDADDSCDDYEDDGNVVDENIENEIKMI